MAKTVLPVDFQDDILNESMNGKRKYNLVPNGDGTYSLEDVSTYDQVGSSYGAGQINAANEAVNASADAGKIIDDIDTIGAVTEDGYIAGAKALKSVNDSLGKVKTYVGEDGKLHFVDSEGADTVLPFNACKVTVIDLTSQTYTMQSDTGFKVVFTVNHTSPAAYVFWSQEYSIKYGSSTITVSEDLKTLSVNCQNTNNNKLVIVE